MAVSRKDEARALNAEERELVERSHHPAVQDLSDQELAQLVKLIRERRDRATGEANRRRREMRGKAAPKGANPSASDAGSKLKVAVLAMAMRRLNSEVENRRRMAASASQVDIARKALAMKLAGVSEGPAYNSRALHMGMRNIPSSRRQDLIRPMELGRQRKAGAIAQAKRDAR